MSKNKPFYCSGSPYADFNIEKWNQEHELAVAMGIEKETVLMGEHDCKEQCERCLNIVIEHHSKKSEHEQE